MVHFEQIKCKDFQYLVFFNCKICFELIRNSTKNDTNGDFKTQQNVLEMFQIFGTAFDFE